jgi:hypothetical protein
MLGWFEQHNIIFPQYSQKINKRPKNMLEKPNITLTRHIFIQQKKQMPSWIFSLAHFFLVYIMGTTNWLLRILKSLSSKFFSKITPFWTNPTFWILGNKILTKILLRICFEFKIHFWNQVEIVHLKVRIRKQQFSTPFWIVRSFCRA